MWSWYASAPGPSQCHASFIVSVHSVLATCIKEAIQLPFSAYLCVDLLSQVHIWEMKSLVIEGSLIIFFKCTSVGMWEKDDILDSLYTPMVPYIYGDYQDYLLNGAYSSTTYV